MKKLLAGAMLFMVIGLLSNNAQTGSAIVIAYSLNTEAEIIEEWSPGGDFTIYNPNGGRD